MNYYNCEVNFNFIYFIHDYYTNISLKYFTWRESNHQFTKYSQEYTRLMNFLLNNGVRNCYIDSRIQQNQLQDLISLAVISSLLN